MGRGPHSILPPQTQAFRKVGKVPKDGDTPVDVVSLSHDKTPNTRAVKVTRVDRCFLTRVDR